VSDRFVSRIEEKLSALGESLPEAKKPVANYLGCKRSGNTLYVSGRVSQIRGEVGTDFGVNPWNWTIIRQKFKPLAEQIVPRTGQVIDSRALNASWPNTFRME
jgi:hypothetical protein